MIPRYQTAQMEAIWNDENKFQTWLDVELAVIKARCDAGQYPTDIYVRIASQARFTCEEIYKREEINEHDLLAFVETVRASLDEDLRKYFHEGLTSYDTEVPAQSIQLREAIDVLQGALTQLIETVRLKASEHMYTYQMGVTHGRDAEPSTFALLLCAHLEMLENAGEFFDLMHEDVQAAKISGAVGNYMTVDPALEAAALEILGLSVRSAATQIVGRDVHSRLLNELAVLGGVIEKMATDLRLLATSAYAEIEEPRKEKQKGSSAMPHKKNPIMLERMCGFAILLRGYASMGQELIRTWLGRDIAHSSVERVAIPDAFHAAHYMLLKMEKVIQKLVVHRERMWSSIDREFGCWASGRVKDLLASKGIDPDEAYGIVQAMAFAAFGTRRPFIDVLWEYRIGGLEVMLSDYVSRDELEACFDFVGQLEHASEVYRRMNLEGTKALPPNIPQQKDPDITLYH